MPSLRTIGIVIPVYNETGVVEQFHTRLRAVIDGLPDRFHIYYINDGSTDGTRGSLEKISESDPRVIIIELSRNFGHQAALTAGLDHAQGDVVITMDGDGQHPPEMIPELLRLVGTGLRYRPDPAFGCEIRKAPSKNGHPAGFTLCSIHLAG